MPIGAEEGALFANESYTMLRKDGKTGNRKKNIETINKNIFKTGYTVVNDKKHTNKDQVTFINDKGHIHISHRGSDLTGKKTSEDLSTWFPIARGATSENEHFKRRLKMTEKTLEAYPNADYVTGSSHSYGGSSLYSTILGSQIARDRFDKIHTYNAGASVFRTAHENQITPEQRKSIRGVVTHHRVEGDAVSGSFVTRKPVVGNVRTIKPRKGRLGMAVDAFFVLTGNKTLKKSADAARFHGLDHFYDADKFVADESESLGE